MIKNSGLFIFYVSEKSLESLYAREELKYAKKYGIPIILVYIDNLTTQDSKAKKIIKGKPIILKYDLDRKDYKDEIMKYVRIGNF